jgi:hypothetical protein
MVTSTRQYFSQLLFDLVRILFNGSNVRRVCTGRSNSGAITPWKRLCRFLQLTLPANVHKSIIYTYVVAAGTCALVTWCRAAVHMCQDQHCSFPSTQSSRAC